MSFREGDFIETIEGLIFDVKGLVHPSNRVIAYLRYVPDEKGDRRRGASRYRKVYSLKAREALLERKYPYYLTVDPVFNEQISEVPIDRIVHHYRPQDKVGLLKREKKLDDVENEALEFIDILMEASGISQRKIGISGSIMVDLHSPTSDIDVIVYGTQNCLLAHSTLREILGNRKGLIKAYNIEGLRKLYSFRVKDTPMSFEEFRRHASRKSSQGTFRGRDFYVRYIKDWDAVEERYGKILYRPLGQEEIKAKVIDDSEAIFTPCRYLVGDVESIERKRFTLLKEVGSFRGRFCQHVRIGESIIARGKLERVTTEKETYYRLLVGGNSQDYIVTISI